MKPLKAIVIIFWIIASAGHAQKPDTLNYINLEPYDFHLSYLRDDSALLIDVREYFEFKRSRIKDAINIPSSAKLEAAADTLSRNMALFLYCTTDFRSIRAAEKLSEKGFRKVYNLTGGIKAWKKDGFLVERKRLR